MDVSHSSYCLHRCIYATFLFSSRQFLAPNMGFRRTLEALAMATHCFMNVWSGVIGTIIVIYLLVWCPVGRYFALAYLLWIYYEFNHVICKGGRGLKCLRSSMYPKLVADYYSMKYTSLAKVSPDKNYILAAFPHGVMASSHCMSNQTANSKGPFPHHDLRLCTTKYNLCAPLQREYFKAMGCISVSEESIKYCLTQNGPGNIVALSPGGIKEMAVAEVGVQNIILNQRKGFCRVALETGCSIIINYAFGETDLVENVPYESAKKGTFLRAYMDFSRWLCGGISILSKNPPRYLIPFILAFPKRVPIHCFYGPVIEVKKVTSPTIEQIEELHAKVVQSVRDVYDQGRHYLQNPDAPLVFV